MAATLRGLSKQLSDAADIIDEASLELEEVFPPMKTSS